MSQFSDSETSSSAVGVIKSCPHCDILTGECKQVRWATSCITCLKHHGFDPVENSGKVVLCSVCGGKKLIWIGPNEIYIPQKSEDISIASEILASLKNLEFQVKQIQETLTKISRT